MAEHFKYFPSDEAVVTPWNARYSYPSQANKSIKMTPRIPPKNGSSFQPGQIIRLEFPAQSYVNPLNTMLEFDVVLFAPTNAGAYAVRFQNNIQSIFNRVRLLYGASPQEDLLQYNVLVRCLTEWTSGSATTTVDRSAITDGIGGSNVAAVTGERAARANATVAIVSGGVATITVASGNTTFPIGDTVSISGGGSALYNGLYVVTGGSGSTITVASAAGNGNFPSLPTVAKALPTFGLTNVRQHDIQGIEGGFVPGSSAFDGYSAAFVKAAGDGCGIVPNSDSSTLPGGIAASGTYSVRRYCVNLALGLFTQDKLIPTKYMASQLAIEITLEQANACIYQPVGYSGNTTAPTYAVGNINLIPEMIDFDDSYDEQFLKGLESGGVPIKFATWHYFQFTTAGSSYLQLQISERSRSVKGLFAVQRRNPSGFEYDSHTCFYDTNPSTSTVTKGSTLQEYQIRMGGRYFPAAPVQCSANVGSTVSNGGAEAYVELEKFLNIVGDYSLGTNTLPMNWAVPAIIDKASSVFSEYDYTLACLGYSAYGIPQFYRSENTTSPFVGGVPSNMFACAVNFETSNGIEISGMNAEEQSDISLNIRWSANQSSGFSIEVFTYIDVMWVLRPNNYLDLIQ